VQVTSEVLQVWLLLPEQNSSQPLGPEQLPQQVRGCWQQTCWLPEQARQAPPQPFQIRL
jgi:hypothetical protein